MAITAALFHRMGGISLALHAVRRRAGAALDPQLAEVLCRGGPAFLGVIDAGDSVEAAVAAEPEPVERIAEASLDGVCGAFGDVVDLKTPFHHDHPGGVAELADAAGKRFGLGIAALSTLRRAALLHDLGRAAVPNGVWERRGGHLVR